MAKNVAHIFRAYDIRGIYGKDLTKKLIENIGNVFRVFVKDVTIVGHDNRLSGPTLNSSFIKGLTGAGIDVIDVGLVPRGVAIFWGWKHSKPVAYISASHLPTEWNGIKFAHGSGEGFFESENIKIRDMCISGDFVKKKLGKVMKQKVLQTYTKYLLSKIPKPKRQVKILLDCGNGTAGIIAPRIFKQLGFKTDTLFAKPDGRFPNRESEIKENTLIEAKKRAHNYDAVIAYDGDADRIAMLDDKGRFVAPEIVARLIIQELLKKEKGPIVANVECSKIIDGIAKGFGRKVIRTRVGYPFVARAIIKNKACFGIEKSMHFCIPAIFPFDDGIAVSLYVGYALSRLDKKLSDFVDAMPKLFNQMMNFDCSDITKFRVIDKIKSEFGKKYKNINLIDGIRVNFPRGWVLIRPSNTSPIIRLTVEADSKAEFSKLKKQFNQFVKRSISKYGTK